LCGSKHPHVGHNMMTYDVTMVTNMWWWYQSTRWQMGLLSVINFWVNSDHSRVLLTN